MRGSKGLSSARTVVPVALGALVAVLAPPAIAAVPRALPAKTLRVHARAIERQYCAVRSVSGPAVSRKTIVSPVDGTIGVTTRGARGADWDLAIVDKATNRVLTGSAQPDARETASTFVRRGQRLVLQTCRRDGSADLRVRYTFTRLPKARPSSYKLKQVRVSVLSAQAARRLQKLGLDLADHPGDLYWDALLHSAADEARLKRAGFSYSVRIKDVLARDRANRLRDTGASAARARARAALSSGRTAYRTLADIESEMKALAEQNPGIARLFELPGRSWEGRRMLGIEIAENVTATDDGRPAFVMVGTHHAREWPANEATLEWAYDLINGYKTGSPRLAGIVKGVRNYIIPVLNVDGFDVTVTSEGLTPGGNYVDPLDSGTAAGSQGRGSGAYKRKNCRPVAGEPNPAPEPPGTCLARSYPNAPTVRDDGVDLNRNYGVEWGGPGTATTRTNLTYHGGWVDPATGQPVARPFSEPETRAMRDFLRNLQPTLLVTNHTFSGLLLRPPGTNRFGPVPDEERLRSIGDAMANETMYRSQFSYQLYDTTGTTDDYVYDGLGGFSFTPEIGFSEFHPAYSEFVAEYEGREQTDRYGDPTGVMLGGLREAYTKAGEMILGRNPNRLRGPEDDYPDQIDSVLTGTAPGGRTLHIAKTISYRTSDRPDDEGVQYPVLTLTDTRDTYLTVPPSGRFTWHVNPSRQPRDFSDQPGFWRLTCEDGSGNVLEQRNVYVERAQTLNLALTCGQGSTPTRPAPVGTCPVPNGFRSVNATRRGHGLRLTIRRAVRHPVTVDIFQTSKGRKVFTRADRVIHFGKRRGSFTWNGLAAGGRALTDGIYYVRFRILDARERIDSRRVVVERKNGRFSKRPGFYLKDRCTR